MRLLNPCSTLSCQLMNSDTNFLQKEQPELIEPKDLARHFFTSQAVSSVETVTQEEEQQQVEEQAQRSKPARTFSLYDLADNIFEHSKKLNTQVGSTQIGVVPLSCDPVKFNKGKLF
jgi:hypothetical protein